MRYTCDEEIVSCHEKRGRHVYSELHGNAKMVKEQLEDTQNTFLFESDCCNHVEVLGMGLRKANKRGDGHNAAIVAWRSICWWGDIMVLIMVACPRSTSGRIMNAAT